MREWFIRYNFVTFIIILHFWLSLFHILDVLKELTFFVQSTILDVIIDHRELHTRITICNDTESLSIVMYEVRNPLTEFKFPHVCGIVGNVHPLHSSARTCIDLKLLAFFYYVCDKSVSAD